MTLDKWIHDENFRNHEIIFINRNLIKIVKLYCLQQDDEPLNDGDIKESRIVKRDI